MWLKIRPNKKDFKVWWNCSNCRNRSSKLQQKRPSRRNKNGRLRLRNKKKPRQEEDSKQNDFYRPRSWRLPRSVESRSSSSSGKRRRKRRRRLQRGKTRKGLKCSISSRWVRSRRLRKLLLKGYASNACNLKSRKSRDRSKEDDSSHRSRRKTSASSNYERKHKRRYKLCIKANLFGKCLLSFSPTLEESLTFYSQTPIFHWLRKNTTTK